MLRPVHTFVDVVILQVQSRGPGYFACRMGGLSMPFEFEVGGINITRVYRLSGGLVQLCMMSMVKFLTCHILVLHGTILVSLSMLPMVVTFSTYFKVCEEGSNLNYKITLMNSGLILSS